MPRTIRIAAAQVGAVHRDANRETTLHRLLDLLCQAATQGAQIVLFPECTFTTFFPRYFFADEAELESFFEHGDVTTAKETRAIFDKARDLEVDICIGFAEATDEGHHYNACIYYHAKSGSILSKYRKIHLPGDVEPFPEPGLTDTTPEDGEPIFGMMICNDRRWAEAWRCLGLQGVEVVLVGFNTPGFAPQMWGASPDVSPQDARAEAIFHHKLVMQAHSYTNACFSVSAARCGLDDGKYDLVGGSTIIGPDGKIMAESKTEDDEVIVADCDLGRCIPGKSRTFDFARHRRTEHYGILTAQTGIIEPSRLSTPASAPDSNGVILEDSQNQCLQSVTGTTGTRQIRILLCNPNATPSMTHACLEMVKSTLTPDVTVTGFTAPKPAPSAIEGGFDDVMSAAAAARAIIPIAHQYDAFLVACYSNHALIKVLREQLSQPVVGIMEASLFAARTLGGRFGVIATSRRSKYTLEESVKHYGLDPFCIGVQSCDLGVLELESKPEKEVLGVMCEVGKKLADEGADVLTLGCAGMTNMKAAVEKAVGSDVQVVDGVLVGVQHLAGLCRLDMRTAKRGMYTSSAGDRERRGQNWY